MTDCCTANGVCKDGPGCPAHLTCPPCNHKCNSGRTCPARQLAEDGTPLTRNDYEELVVLTVIAALISGAVLYVGWHVIDFLFSLEWMP